MLKVDMYRKLDQMFSTCEKLKKALAHCRTALGREDCAKRKKHTETRDEKTAYQRNMKDRCVKFSLYVLKNP